MLLEFIDAFLIAPYRWPSDPLLGWGLGTAILAVWATLLGEMTMAIAIRVNRFVLKDAAHEMEKRHTQSMNAIRSGDKKAYKAINKLANEAFGKTFFLQVAMAAASLWPVPFALAWMQTRFSEIRFPLVASLPLVGDSVGYAFVFIPLYILTRIIFGKAKIPFRRASL